MVLLKVQISCLLVQLFWVNSFITDRYRLERISRLNCSFLFYFQEALLCWVLSMPAFLFFSSLLLMLVTLIRESWKWMNFQKTYDQKMAILFMIFVNWSCRLLNTIKFIAGVFIFYLSLAIFLRALAFSFQRLIAFSNRRRFSSFRATISLFKSVILALLAASSSRMSLGSILEAKLIYQEKEEERITAMFFADSILKPVSARLCLI